VGRTKKTIGEERRYIFYEKGGNLANCCGRDLPKQETRAAISQGRKEKASAICAREGRHKNESFQEHVRTSRPNLKERRKTPSRKGRKKGQQLLGKHMEKENAAPSSIEGKTPHNGEKENPSWGGGRQERSSDLSRTSAPKGGWF